MLPAFVDQHPISSGDLHKWAFTHRGCAVLYVNPKLKTKPVPLAISASYVEKDDWRAGFFDQGTDAVSKFSVVKDALNFIKDKGYVSWYCCI